MADKGKRFDKEFKTDAVKLVLEKGRTMASVARDLHINENTIQRWVKEYKGDPVHSFPGSGHLHPDDEEVRKLKRRVSDLEMENEILKKAMAIFANPRR